MHSVTTTSIVQDGLYLDFASKALFLGQLDLTPLGLKLLVISMLTQALQQICLRDPLVSAQSLCDEAGKLRVAVRQPAARGHTIGLVLKLLWSQVVEVLQTMSKNMSSCQTKIYAWRSMT